MPTILWWRSGRVQPLSALLRPAESLDSEGPAGLWGLGKNQTNLLTPAGTRTADMWNRWHKQTRANSEWYGDFLCLWSCRRRSPWPCVCGTSSSWRGRGCSPPCPTLSSRYTRVRRQISHYLLNSTECFKPQTPVTLSCLTNYWNEVILKTFSCLAFLKVSSCGRVQTSGFNRWLFWVSHF